MKNNDIPDPSDIVDIINDWYWIKINKRAAYLHEDQFVASHIVRQLQAVVAVCSKKEILKLGSLWLTHITTNHAEIYKWKEFHWNYFLSALYYQKLTYWLLPV